jgi:ATP-dependent DNA helicase RecG
MAPLGNLYTAQFLAAADVLGLVLHIIIGKTREIIEATGGIAYVRRGAQKLSVTEINALHRLRLDKGLSSFEDDTMNVPLDSITNSLTTLEFKIDQVPGAELEPWLRSQFLVALLAQASTAARISAAFCRTFSSSSAF